MLQLWRGDRARATSAVGILFSLAGCVGSVGLMLRAGRDNSSLVLLALFAVWVLSPFAAMLLLCKISQQWSAATRLAVVGLTVGLAVGTLAIYGNVAASSRGSKVAFPFIVVPCGSWLVIATVIPLVGLMSRRLSRFRLLRWSIKSIAGGSVLGVLGIATLLGLLLFDHNKDTILPMPTGPFAVGRAMFLWHSEEIDPLAPMGTTRKLVAWIWYPAAAAEPSAPVVDYLPAAWRTAMENKSGVLLSQFLTRDLSRVHAHSLLDAPLSPQRPAYPVVLLRGGGATLTTDYTTLAEDLASHGYVVVGFDAPHRSWLVVLPDGTIIPRASQNDLDGVDGSQADRRAETLARAWAADCGFVVDQLERLNTSESSGRFQGRLDLERIGIVGHSLGGATALWFCHDDSRCRAGIDIDGAPVGRVIADGVARPFMFINGDHSRESPTTDAPELIRNARANIQSIFDRLPAESRMMVEIRGANHYLFSDNGALLKSPLVMRVLRLLEIVRLDGRRQLAVTARCVHSFFDVYLQGATPAELKSQLECPEIELQP